MGYTTSTVHGIQVPDSAQANNIPTDLGNVVTALEGGSIVRRLTGAQISALTGPQKPAGLVVYNTTTNRAQISDGSTFADIHDDRATYVIGTRSTTLSLSAGAWTTVTYPTEDDPSAILSAGVVTLPSAGRWSVHGYIEVSSGGGAASDVFVAALSFDGSDVAIDSSSTSNTVVAHYCSVSAVVNATTSGKTVSMRAYNGAAGARNLVTARLSVGRV